MAKTKRAVVDECYDGCTHEPWPYIGWEEGGEKSVWHLCTTYLAREGRGTAWRIEPLVFAHYGDEAGDFIRANEIDGELIAARKEQGHAVKEYVPAICAWPIGHDQACDARSVYRAGLDELYEAMPENKKCEYLLHTFGITDTRESFRWHDIKHEVLYGVCRRHLPNLLGIEPVNRSRTKVRDFQRSRVYKWEGGVLPNIHTPSMTLDDSRELVHAIWNAHAPDEFPPPQVLLGRSKYRSSGSYKRIRLSPIHLNLIVTIHETAHGLLSAAGSCDRHGPLFMRLYLELLERYAGETPEPAQNLKVASYQELAAVEGLRGFEIAEKVAA